MAARERKILSMTGFGRGAAGGKRFRVTAELRSVNGRFLEIRSKLPRSLAFLEPKVRSMLESQLQRGAVDLTLTVHSLSVVVSSQIDHNLAAAYAAAAEAVGKKLNLAHGLTALSLFKLPGVLGADGILSLEEEEEIPAIVESAVAEALANLMEMRRREGEKLALVLARELAEVESHRGWIQQHRAELNERYARRLGQRVKDWAEKNHGTLDEGRLAQEVAYYLDRSDVTEELDRLGSHLRQCEAALATPGGKSAGKRLEFLSQEMGREVNTIGAKSDQVQVTQHVVEMKLTLEKFREQVQNLE